ncbi:hypothetical protein D3C71_1260990 [compost metagenome]
MFSMPYPPVSPAWSIFPRAAGMSATGMLFALSAPTSGTISRDFLPAARPVCCTVGSMANASSRESPLLPSKSFKASAASSRVPPCRFAIEMAA